MPERLDAQFPQLRVAKLGQHFEIHGVIEECLLVPRQTELV
jgi:hypothetical protein